MPRPRGRPSPFQALAGGFAGGIGQGLQYGMMRRLMQKRKGRQDILSAMKEEAKWTAEAYTKESPEYNAIVLKILAELRGEDPRQKQQRMGRMPFPALGQKRPIRTPEVREAFIGAGAERAGALTAVGKERISEITTARKEEKAILKKRAEELMKQRRDFLRGDPIMTALGGLIQPQWSDETEGVNLNNILSDLRLRHRFTYPKSVMDALKLTAPELGPPKPETLQQQFRDKETGEIVNMRWNGTEWVKVD